MSTPPMPDARARVAALIGNHTAVHDGHPVPVWQLVGAATVEEIAATVHDDVVAPIERQRDNARIEAEVNDGVARMVADDRDEALGNCMALEQQRDTARAALAEIRDRHQRHGEHCGTCTDFDPEQADACNDCREPWPCPDRRTAERGLGAKEET